MSWTTYLGHDVLDRVPNWASSVELPFLRDTQLFQELGLGAAWSNFSQTIMGLKADYQCWTKGDIADLSAFFDDKLGRLTPFWVPTWQSDIIVKAGIGASDTTITIDDVKYSEYWGQDIASGRYLFFFLPDGTYLIRKVTSWPTANTLTIDAALGQAVTADQLDALLVSFLLLVRFDSDDLELEYLTDCVAKTTLNFRSVLGEV